MLRARPRSLLGLVFALVALVARRRPVACAIACGGLAVCLGLGLGLGLGAGGAPGPAAAPRAASDLRAAVLRDGFAVHRAAASGHHLTEIDPGGATRRVVELARPGELRAIGTRGGLAVAWQDGSKLQLQLVDGRQPSTWGKSVRQLCDGVASNDARFGVGWLEADDTVWVVHGPVAAEGAAAGDAGAAGEPDATALDVPAAARNEWCGVASAEQNIALLWRAGDKLNLLMCTRKRCGGLAGTTRLPRDIPILGAGCLRDACLFATRDASGATQLTYVTSSGRRKWGVPLAATSPTVSIIGYGDRALAVGYAGSDGAAVVRFDTSGTATPLWRDRASRDAPALAWSAGRMLVAHRHGDQIASEVIAVPR